MDLPMAERKHAGTFHVTGPTPPISMEAFLNTCQAATSSNATLVYADESFLINHNGASLDGNAIWIPEQFPLEGQTAPWTGATTISIDRALKAGLRFRPLQDTITEVHEWEQTRNDTEQTGGLSRAREQELLDMLT